MRYPFTSPYNHKKYVRNNFMEYSVVEHFTLLQHILEYFKCILSCFEFQIHTAERKGEEIRFRPYMVSA